MATKIRLMRLGKIRVPQYRIVVTDSRTKRDGRFIEALGKYHPKEDPSFIEVNSERVQYWLSVGAQPTEPVAAILKVTGDWQRFRGEAAESTLRTRAERPDRKRIFEEAAREGLGGDAGRGGEETPAATPRRARSGSAAAASPEQANGAQSAESAVVAPETGATPPASDSNTAEQAPAEADA